MTSNLKNEKNGGGKYNKEVMFKIRQYLGTFVHEIRFSSQMCHKQSPPLLQEKIIKQGV
jgi:hypothetical protein